MNASASGRGALAYGYGANSSGENAIAIGGFAEATQENSVAIGAGASTSRSDQIVLGTDNSEITAPNLREKNELDINKTKDSMGMVMAQSDGTLVRTNAVTTKGGNTTINGNTITIGDDKSTIKMPGQSGDGGGLLGVDSDGILVTIDADIDIDDIDGGDIINNTAKIDKNTKRIKKLEKGMDRIKGAAEAAGAVGAALSGIPELSPFADEPVRCGISAGGYGS